MFGMDINPTVNNNVQKLEDKYVRQYPNNVVKQINAV